MKQSEAQIDKLDEIVLLSILYDFYGELLSDHKKQIFEDYVLNDLSLSEIAAEQGISRQGVYDIVKRCTSELKGYEAKLSLMRKFQTIEDKITTIKDIVANTTTTGDATQIVKIATLADDILKEL
ncbi:MAG: DNA-binding protein [Mobilitalea sp.]